MFFEFLNFFKKRVFRLTCIAFLTCIALLSSCSSYVYKTEKIDSVKNHYTFDDVYNEYLFVSSELKKAPVLWYKKIDWEKENRESYLDRVKKTYITSDEIRDEKREEILKDKEIINDERKIVNDKIRLINSDIVENRKTINEIDLKIKNIIIRIREEKNKIPRFDSTKDEILVALNLKKQNDLIKKEIEEVEKIAFEKQLLVKKLEKTKDDLEKTKASEIIKHEEFKSVKIKERDLEEIELKKIDKKLLPVLDREKKLLDKWAEEDSRRHIPEFTVNYVFEEDQENSVLMYYIENINDLDFLKFLFNEYTGNLNYCNNDDETLFTFAISKKKDLPVLKLIASELVKRGEILNFSCNKKWSPLNILTRTSKNNDILKFILKNEKKKNLVTNFYKFDDNINPLNLAIFNENYNAVKILNNYAFDAIIEKEYRNDNDNDGLNNYGFKSKNYSFFPLLLSVKYNKNPDIFKYLIRIGGDAFYKDENGLNLIMISAMNNRNEKFIEHLIDLGIDFKTHRDKQGNLPILFAAAYDEKGDVYDFLLKKGSPLQVSNFKGENSLTLAIKYNKNDDVVKKIIGLKGNVNSSTALQQSPLIYAIKYNRNLDIIKHLLEAGARVNKRDIEGWTALSYANNYKRSKEIVDLLKKNGAIDPTR